MENSNLILGRTSLFAILPVEVDANGRLVVNISSMPNVVLGAGTSHIGQVSIDTALPAGNNQIGNVGIKGLYGGLWRSAPIPFGVSAAYADAKVTNLPAGTSTTDHPALAANAFTVVTNWAVNYVGTVAGVTLSLVRMVGGSAGTTIYIARFANLVSNMYYNWAGKLVLEPNDILRVTVTGATLNDDVYSHITGYYYSRNL